jgi:hypothetical protein
MPAVTYNYVTFRAGSHQRQPTRTGPGGFTVLQSNSGGSPTSGTFAAPSPPKTISIVAPPETFDFSFMTVSGGSQTLGGPPVGLTSFDSSNPPPPVFVGNTPINVVVVYVATGGGSTGNGTGATIDEFDQTTGQLINDTFVTVTPDPDGTLAASGNVEGFVATMNAEEIVALPTTSPTGVDFVDWVKLGPPAERSASPTLAVGSAQSVLALAFYQAPPVGTIAGNVSEEVGGTLRILEVAFHVQVSPSSGTTIFHPGGNYIVTNLPPGPATIVVSAAFRTSATKTVTVRAGETITENFVLTRL